MLSSNNPFKNILDKTEYEFVRIERRVHYSTQRSVEAIAREMIFVHYSSPRGNFTCFALLSSGQRSDNRNDNNRKRLHTQCAIGAVKVLFSAIYYLHFKIKSEKHDENVPATFGRGG